MDPSSYARVSRLRVRVRVEVSVRAWMGLHKLDDLRLAPTVNLTLTLTLTRIGLHKLDELGLSKDAFTYWG